MVKYIVECHKLRHFVYLDCHIVVKYRWVYSLTESGKKTK